MEPWCRLLRDEEDDEEALARVAAVAKTVKVKAIRAAPSVGIVKCIF